MSLTSFLKKPEVKAKFNEEFAKPRFKYSKDLLAEPLTKHYSIVGTAFDYLARFYIEHINKGNIVESGKWVAEIYVERSFLGPRTTRKYKKIIKDAQKRKKKFIKNGKMTDKLIESTARLAKIDIIHRSAYPPDETFDIIDPEDIEDLRNLYNQFIQHDWTAKDICFLNPTFNEASLMVGGADADLIIDDMLIDIKSVKAAGMKRTDFDQLMGYYLLNEVGGITGHTGKHSINKVAIYSSRYSELMVLDIENIFDTGKLPGLKEWLKEVAG
jgi:hypothetical protein